jgi:hypothetical protein
VKLANQSLPGISYKEAVERLLDGEVESCSQLQGQLVADVEYHPVVAAAHLAFCEHRPLSLSPDMIWLLLCQGVAHHVRANAEELRRQFVWHQGKEKIAIRRDDFVKGSPENPWPEVFSEFSLAIREYIGPNHELFVTNFSTTGPSEKATFEVVLMDAVQSYFDYEFHSLCGIPSITLEGNTRDWQQVRDRASLFSAFDLEWWIPQVMPILDQFVEARNGKVNRAFWSSLYKLNDDSGGPYVTGWLVNFFPYLRDFGGGYATPRNTFLMDLANSHESGLSRERQEERLFSGLTLPSFPAGLSSVPVRWMCLESEFEMQFCAGFVGVKQDQQTMALRPEIGWAVRDITAPKNLRQKRRQRQQAKWMKANDFPV